MDLQESKKLINEAKSIYLIPVKSANLEGIVSALALFYTLKESGKNVNILIDDMPEILNFLAPSLDFITLPKNFVISIPKSIAEISQIYYEKNDEALKIHLAIEKGSVKKDNISFYFSETKPDLIITLGVKDYEIELKSKLDSFGFLLGSPILNIDNTTENKNFGKINIIEDRPLSAIIFNLAENITPKTANCLLAGLIIYTDNFKNNVTAEIFETAGSLIKKGANLKEITNNISKQNA